MGGTIVIVLLFVGVVIAGAAAYAGLTLMAPQRTASDRIAEFTGGTQEGDKIDPVAERIAERLAKLAAPDSEEGRNILRQKLTMAGFKSRHAPQVFSAVRVSLALILPVLFAPIAATVNVQMLAMGVLVLAAGGYYGPQMYIDSLTTSRKQRLQRPLPDALDLLVTTVEAGLGLDAAFRRVADELGNTAPDLAEEFQMVNHEISAGIARIEALRHLDERTGVPEIRSLVNMLAQAERFGTSIARSLRIHSEITRQKRMSRAEEEAAKVSPKLTVVMILFQMPCLFIILLGPAIVNISHSPILE